MKIIIKIILKNAEFDWSEKIQDWNHFTGQKEQTYIFPTLANLSTRILRRKF